MTIRVRAYQANPGFSTHERIQHSLEALKKADDQQLDFLCFPEGFITGYYAEKEQAERTAIAITDSDFQDFLKQSASFKVTFIIGFNEKAKDKIFDSAAVIEKGKLLGVERKHYLYHNYFTRWSFI